MTEHHQQLIAVATRIAVALEQIASTVEPVVCKDDVTRGVLRSFSTDPIKVERRNGG